MRTELRSGWHATRTADASATRVDMDVAPAPAVFFVAYTNNELGRRMWTLMSLTQLHELR